jgi:glycosyltransferase involved in cell wall biosynthesis
MKFPVALIRYFYKKTSPPPPWLGVLRQHAPRSMLLPSYYARPITMRNFPSIAIVTPSFNQGEFIERTIQSIITQNYPNLEYIIQDGGSCDATQTILERYNSMLRHWESRADQGQSHAINLGFAHSSAEIMAYLNSDDLLLPGALHYVANYFAQHPEIDVVYGHRIIIDENDQEIGRWVLPPHNSKVLTVEDFVPQETLFWRRRIWNKVGGIDESFKFAMDWDLLLRFQHEGAKFKRLPRFLGAFRVHTQQKTSAEMEITGKKEIERLLIRYHGRVLNALEIKRQGIFYLLQHVGYQLLYKLGILRY